MLVRLVSLILIPAMIACPMSCVVGSCQGDRLADESTSRPTTGCCCQHDENREAVPSENNRDCPGDAPCKQPCQGVCGGVVFEKPVELNPVLDFDFPLAVAVGDFVSIPTATRETQDRGDLLPSRYSYGRYVCALHMSFLC